MNPANEPPIKKGNGPRPCRKGLKPATTYLTPDARRQLLRIGWETEKTIEAILREGLDHVFAKHGLPEIAQIKRAGGPA